jgi:hypothetical protein
MARMLVEVEIEDAESQHLSDLLQGAMALGDSLVLVDPTCLRERFSLRVHSIGGFRPGGEVVLLGWPKGAPPRGERGIFR